MTEGNPNLPDQKELEKEIGDYLSRKYGTNVKIISSGLHPFAEISGPGKEDNVKERKEPFQFDLKPEELITYLNEYVIQQDETKAILATKICTHFNRIRYGLDHPEQAKRGVGQIKSNVLLIGPTGVGKTFLIKLIAQRLGVPFIKGDATKFSETGYVGGDVEDLVRDLVRQADGDIERAQYGIIYIDEIDKIASSSQHFGADVSRTGVQRALLKPMEETDVDLKVPHDPISQIEAIERFRATGKREKRVVNTKNILFIMSGAFAGLEDIVKTRIQQQAIGFGGTITSKKETARFLKKVKAEDLIQFGFESEFVGRLPIVSVLNELSVDDLYEILMNPNSSVVVAKKQDFRAYGIHVHFEDEALWEIAQKAYKEQTGARGLVSVMEKILLHFEKSLPSSGINYLAVTADLVHDPARELEKLFNDPDHKQFHKERYEVLEHIEYKRLIDFILQRMGVYLEDHDIIATPARIALMAKQCQKDQMDPRDVCDIFIELIKTINENVEKLSSKCGIHVRFNDDAIDRILARQPRNAENITKVCESIANALEYGLRLLSQKKGVDHVVVDAGGVDSPDLFINKLVGNSFQLNSPDDR